MAQILDSLILLYSLIFITGKWNKQTAHRFCFWARSNAITITHTKRSPRTMYRNVLLLTLNEMYKLKWLFYLKFYSLQFN